MLESIYISPYTLTFKDKDISSLSSRIRKGALIKICFKTGLIGYADIHPWEELGDDPLNRQLNHLKNQKLTPLTARSLNYAFIDAQARAKKISLFDKLNMPRSHYLLSSLSAAMPEKIDEIASRGFAYIKVKLGRNLTKEVPLLKRVLKLGKKNKLFFRLDFNGALTPKAFQHLTCEIDSLKETIQFFEDPFPENVQLWNQQQLLTHIPFAHDRNSLSCNVQDLTCPILVLKPATQNITTLVKYPIRRRSFVVTSYLDHPLGVTSAAYFAARLNTKFPNQNLDAGLLSMHLYRSNRYSEVLQTKTSFFPPPKGVGFGFDELLSKEKWIKL